MGRSQAGAAPSRPGAVSGHRKIPESDDILDSKNTRGLLKKGYQVFFMSKDNTGEAEFQGKEVLFMSKDDIGEAKFQGKEVLFMSKVDTGPVPGQGGALHVQG